MTIDTTTLIISGALLVGALAVLVTGHLRRRRRFGRRLVQDLLRSYFRGDVPFDQLGPRAREIVGRRFTQSDEFYSLAASAFQRAADAALLPQAQPGLSERRLLNAMATLKREFGLTDLYHLEDRRPWRE
ncbi:MAG TPA: hypothetical protein VMU69_02035 [Bradyrhizobium sp.]|nr:hypothetical protein [Bradyrhizobium sp.]